MNWAGDRLKQAFKVHRNVKQWNGPELDLESVNVEASIVSIQAGACAMYQIVQLIMT